MVMDIMARDRIGDGTKIGEGDITLGSNRGVGKWLWRYIREKNT